MGNRFTKILASVDANAVIHFYRAGFEWEPGYVLDGLIDPFVMREIECRAGDVHLRVAANMAEEGYWLRLGAREKLNSIQKNLYDQSYKVNKLMFDPQDWGEAAAIALGHAAGAVVLLTDDTKKSGPRDYILKGAIEAIDTIAFWEVLLLLYAAGKLTPAEFAVAFDRIKNEGYDVPPRVSCRTDVTLSIDRLRRCRWFKEWQQVNEIVEASFAELIGFIDRNDWPR